MPSPETAAPVTALDDLVAGGRSAGLVLDFDGVLSPIVDDPAASAMPPATAALLERIASGLGVVALLSGRPLDFLIDRATIPGVVLFGSYGVESFRDGRRTTHPALAEWTDRVVAARDRLESELAGVEGVHVEDKAVAVAVHWRRAPDRAAAGDAVTRATSAVAAGSGLELEPGKLVVELRPPLDSDKGTAVREIIGAYGLQRIAYGGDDLGDVPAFRAVHAAGGSALLVEHGAETADVLRDLATERFDGVDGFRAWLERLAQAL